MPADGNGWIPDPWTLERWDALVPGTALTVVKRSHKHGGAERARYPATVVNLDSPSPWVAVETPWTLGTVTQAHITFQTGDTLHEVFSPSHPFDAFAVYGPDAALKGWYANVTHPALLEPCGDGLQLVWHDLYVDVVATPDGRMAVLDEDELNEAGIAHSDPDLHRRILTALDELIARFHARRPPFLGDVTKRDDGR